MNERDLLEKLTGLGAERLATALLELAVCSPEAREHVERLVAAPSDRLAKAKAALAGLARARRFYSYAESGTLARKLEVILADIDADQPAPEEGLRLVARFFESDRAVFERCDDSGGGVGMVFTFDARELFARYAAACADKTRIAKLVLALYGEDDYGVRGALIDEAASFLPAEAVRTLAQDCWDRAMQSGNPEDGKACHWFTAVRSLARQLADAPLFEKALRASSPDLYPGAELELAKAYLEAGDAATALAWLEREGQVGRFLQGDRDRLLLEVHRKLGDQAGLEDAAWRIFRAGRSAKALEDLLLVIGEDQRARVVREETRKILDEDHFSISSASFLIVLGLSDEAEAYLLRRAGQLNGDLYDSLLPLAKALERHGCALAATAVYRALLDSILQRAQYKAYPHGADYLRKLDALAGAVEDWQSIQPHAVYAQALAKAHGRKSGFWGHYRAGG